MPISVVQTSALDERPRSEVVVPLSIDPMTSPDNDPTARLSRTAELHRLIYDSAAELTRLHGRPFTMDGHLVGALGEVAALHLFDLILERGSNEGFDARTTNGRRVEIKATGNSKGEVRVYATSNTHADDLIVLVLQADGAVEVIYDGPFETVAPFIGKVGNSGQGPLRLSVCRREQTNVDSSQRVPRR